MRTAAIETVVENYEPLTQDMEEINRNSHDEYGAMQEEFWFNFILLVLILALSFLTLFFPLLSNFLVFFKRRMFHCKRHPP